MVHSGRHSPTTPPEAFKQQKNAVVEEEECNRLRAALMEANGSRAAAERELAVMRCQIIEAEDEVVEVRQQAAAAEARLRISHDNESKLTVQANTLRQQLDVTLAEKQECRDEIERIRQEKGQPLPHPPSAADGPPVTLVVVAFDAAQAVGNYDLMHGTFNGHPVWCCGDRRLYTHSENKTWTIALTEQQMVQGKGCLRSTTPHDGVTPEGVGSWQRYSAAQQVWCPANASITPVWHEGDKGSVETLMTILLNTIERSRHIREERDQLAEEREFLRERVQALDAKLQSIVTEKYELQQELQGKERDPPAHVVEQCHQFEQQMQELCKQLTDKRDELGRQTQHLKQLSSKPTIPAALASLRDVLVRTSNNDNILFNNCHSNAALQKVDALCQQALVSLSPGEVDCMYVRIVQHLLVLEESAGEKEPPPPPQDDNGEEEQLSAALSALLLPPSHCYTEGDRHPAVPHLHTSAEDLQTNSPPPPPPPVRSPSPHVKNKPAPAPASATHPMDAPPRPDDPVSLFEGYDASIL